MRYFKVLSKVLFLTVFTVLCMQHLFNYHVQAQESCPDSMTAYWKLDEVSGFTFTDFFSTNDGQCSASCPDPVSGRINGGQQFDMSLGTGISVSGQDFNWAKDDSFSIEYWIKKETGTLSGDEAIVGRGFGLGGFGWWTGLWSSGEAAFVLVGNSGDGSGSANYLHGSNNLADGKWHHLVFVRDGFAGQNRMYVDGMLKDSVSIIYSDGFDDPADTLNIGWTQSIANVGYTGIVDQIAIYERALTEREIRSHAFLVLDYCYSCGLPVKIMLAGDSITAGQSSGVTDPAYQIGFRKDLWDNLLMSGYNVDFVGGQRNGDAYEATEGFDPDHEGHGGWADHTLAGQIPSWLVSHSPDIVCISIGTNSLSPSANEVNTILNHIDSYSLDIPVILSKITNWVPYNSVVTAFNNNIEALALSRISDGDKIIIVDQENGAGINYALTPVGDMYDTLHPYVTGYTKMAVYCLPLWTVSYRYVIWLQ